MSGSQRIRIGELRPSQLIWAFGPGALVDLPQMSVSVLGLEFWDNMRSEAIPEPRLLSAVRHSLGPQVEKLLSVPLRQDQDSPLGPDMFESLVGVPATPFPKWLRCTKCQTLAPFDSGLFSVEEDKYRPDRVRFVHSVCQKTSGSAKAMAVPSRFLVACRAGHLDDFPWHWFVHRGPSTCKGMLRFFEMDASMQTEDLWVGCDACGLKRTMAEAFGERGKRSLPGCRGRHPHLGTYNPDCHEELRAILLGASNNWFPITLSALAIPPHEDRLAQLVEDNWYTLGAIENRAQFDAALPVFLKTVLREFRDFSPDAIWASIERKRKAGSRQIETTDLKKPEWDVLVDPRGKSDSDFMVTPSSVPSGFEGRIRSVALLERLREVNAIIGFTRIEPPEETFGTGTAPERAPISVMPPEWVPANEVRGEGIFIEFDLDRITKWATASAVTEEADKLLIGHKAWRAARKLEPPDAGFPGPAFVMLHTLSHLLIRELSLECGYGAASIRERIYSTTPGSTSSMAGVLLYTAAPDSDGTLGGLVELGRPGNLERLLRQALQRATICSADPLCSEHVPARDGSLHAAACHACCFVPETSCEYGNRYLDRALLVDTMTTGGASFFGDISR